MQCAFDDPSIGIWMCPERNDAGDAGLFGAAAQVGKLRNVTIDDGGTTRLDAKKDLGLGIGDFGERAQELQMHGRDRGDDCDMRPDQPG
jgi:hypothetical protein